MSTLTCSSTGKTTKTPPVVVSADDVLCAVPTTLLFLREFLVGTATSRRKALLGVAAPVVGCILRLRGTKRLTASEVVAAFSKDVSKTRNTTTKKKGGPNNNTEMRFFDDDATLVNAYSILVLAASVLPENLRDVTFLPGGPVVRVFSEKYAFDVDVVRLPKMNLPKIGNFLVFDVYSSQNETLFGGRGQGFRYNVFLTPRYVVFDVPVYAYKQFKRSKLAKAKCIVKSQKFGFELDLIETLNPFTVPQRLFFRTTKVIGKVSDAVIAKPAKIARRQFVRTVLRREPREPRQLTFLERVQVMFGVLDAEDIENEPESPKRSLLPFSKPEPLNSKSASSKNSSTRGSKANSKAASGRSTPKRKENDITSDASTSDVTQLLPRLKSFSEIKEDVDTFFQGTPEEQAARKKSEEDAKKKFEREQKKKQKELAQKRDREMKEQKKKAQDEEKAKRKKMQEEEEERRWREEKLLAEAEGRRMVEVNDSYFNRYVPDVADAIIKAPTAVESPSKK